MWLLILFALVETLLALDLIRHKQWLMGANARRKRTQRALRRQKAKYDRLYRQHQHLIGEVTGSLLLDQDRDTVAKGLTRKL